MEMNWLSYEEVLGDDYCQDLSLLSILKNSWPDYLLEDEALQFYTTSTQTSSLQDELDACLEGDVLSFWGDPMQEVEHKNEAPAKKARRVAGGAEEKALTFEVVSQYFYMPIMQAARELNVGLTLLKRRCRELGIPRWPHRKMKSLQALIDNVQVLQGSGDEEGDEQVRSVVEMLQKEKRLIEQKPHVDMEERTKRLRQACFKANYKRRLVAPGAGEVPWLLD